jgi:hypothetical protein
LDGASLIEALEGRMSDDVMPYAGVPLRGEKVSIPTPSLAPVDVTIRDMAAVGRDWIGSAIVAGKAALAEGTRRAPALGPGLAVCGAIALWAAPALLLSRYQPAQLFDALVRVSLKPSGSELLTLSLVLTYFVLTGLALGTVTTFAHRRASRIILRLAVTPLVIGSILATLIVAVPFFFGTLVLCFPQLV